MIPSPLPIIPITVIQSPWTPLAISALIGSVAVLIPVVIAGIVTLLGLRKSVKEAQVEASAARAETVVSRVAGAQAGEARDGKLAEIAASVDGNLTKLQAELASVQEQNKMLLKLVGQLSQGLNGRKRDSDAGLQ